MRLKRLLSEMQAAGIEFDGNLWRTPADKERGVFEDLLKQLPDEAMRMRFGTMRPDGQFADPEIELPCDFLSITRKGGTMLHDGAQVDCLKRAGINASITWRDDYEALIREYDPKVIYNRSYTMDSGYLRYLAMKYRDKIFITGVHGSMSYLLKFKELLPKHHEAWTLMERLPNVYLAHVHPRFALQQFHERCIWMPNPVRHPPAYPKTPNELPRLSICCRNDLIKNIPGLIVAAAIANRAMPLELHLITQDPHQGFADLADDLKLLCRCVGWFYHWEPLMEYVCRNIDLGLQVSFSDTYNYVAADHLMAGIPVLGMSSMDFLPKAWQCNPEEPEQIARAIVDVFDKPEATKARGTDARTELLKYDAKLVSVVRSFVG